MLCSCFLTGMKNCLFACYYRTGTNNFAEERTLTKCNYGRKRSSQLPKQTQRTGFLGQVSSVVCCDELDTYDYCIVDFWGSNTRSRIVLLQEI